jgi:hypothetical protein
MPRAARVRCALATFRVTITGMAHETEKQIRREVAGGRALFWLPVVQARFAANLIRGFLSFPEAGLVGRIVLSCQDARR